MNPVFKQCAKTIAVFGMLMGTIGTSHATNPHFIGKVTATINKDTGAVQMCFKVAGLGYSENIDISASGTATATYVCRNAGGNCPQGSDKKTTVTGPVTAMQRFTAERNGQVEACITLNPPSAGKFTCPGNQQVVLSSVSFSNLKVTAGAHGPSATATPPNLSINRGACPAP